MPELIGIGCIYLEPHLPRSEPGYPRDCADYTVTEDGQVIGFMKIATADQSVPS